MKILTAILTDLRAAIADRAARDRALTAVLVLVWGRLSRAAARLERLYGLWLAGTLPAPRTAGVRAAQAPVTDRPKVPRGRGWLAIRVWEARASGSRLQHLLADPGFAAFVAEVPRAGRVLRPILRMLTVDALPPVLAVAAAPQQEAGIAARKREKPAAAAVWPRKGLPRLPKGAWFEPPGPNWGKGG